MTRFQRFLSGGDSSLKSPPSAKGATADAPTGPGVNVESDFVVILAALLCALICVVGLIAVARCAWLRRGGGGTARSGRLASANKGLKKKVLQSLPKFTYDSASPSATAAGKVAFVADCAICLAEYVDGDEIRVLPQCGHGFHVQCIDTWLGSHSSCPSCRQILAVTRCKKCGEFPITVLSGTAATLAGPSAETELKSRQDRAASSNSNDFLP